ncbi:MAG TPA: DUF721 domain-containing protein [bacterium]|nr:DUF721 domain-containing protein [bacterium]
MNRTQRQSFSSIGSLLKKKLAGPEHEPLQKTVALHQQWLKIVGPIISRHSRILYIKDGCLFVSVAHPAWHNELSLMKNQILKQIQEQLPDTKVTSIKFKTDAESQYEKGTKRTF